MLVSGSKRKAKSTDEWKPKRSTIYLLVRFLNGEDNRVVEAPPRSEFLNRASLVYEHNVDLEQIRKEMIQDITPILRPTASRLEHIRDVVEKISAMDLKPSWSVKPAALTLEFSDGGVPVQLKSPSGPGMGFLKFGAESYAVRFSPANFARDKNDFVGFARKVFYGHLISALEDGTFSYLGRCSECERFFVTKRLGVKYCAKKCMTRADAKKATLRVRSLRLQLRRQQQTKMENAIDRKRFARFEEFMALVARNHHKIGELDKMRPILRELGKGEQRDGWKIAQKWERQIRDGVSLGTLWSNQIMTVKGIF
jgi:hypothetical protein